MRTQKNARFDIGMVKLNFNAEGKVTESIFWPTIVSDYTPIPKEFESALMNLSAVKTAEEAASQALASYFVLLGNIEAHDPEKGSIKQEIIKCDEYSNKVPHTCEIRFYSESR
jgi:hypothetical protein